MGFAENVRAARPDLGVTDAVAARLAARVAEARRAWPDVDVPDARFAAFLARHLDAPVDAAAERLHVADLYLACGCIDRLGPALAAFDRTCAPVIDRAVASVGARPAEAADLRQVVRTRLLVASVTPAGDGEPRLAGYRGRGSLASWVRVVATREAQRLLPRERREPSAADDALDRLVAPDDVELGYLKRLYRAEFRAAVEAAIAALSARERMLLQQHALDGLSIDELAAFYRCHRATAARWIERARAAVLDGTRAQLVARLQLSEGELESILRLISSQLDVSLPRLLAARGDGQPR